MDTIQTYDESLSTHQSGSSDPIAIVAIGCRFPGDAMSPSNLWELLLNGRSGCSEIEGSQLDMHLGGKVLEHDTRLFDNGLFGINSLEASYMDPQQRQLLEVCYECFESAGLTLEMLSGADLGCYIANGLSDFLVMQFKDPQLLHRYSATGMGSNFLSNRISHAFNLKGPSVVMDTACSSSLYTLHTACHALHMGECKSAVVAGANLFQSPEFHLVMTEAGFLSPTSTSHTFDSSADGYGRGEGVAVLYLKRLSDAIKDGDRIRSVIRGTAVNSNGHTNGIAFPSVAGQEAVIRKAYAMAGLPTTETTYIETHGTGTPVGDPIEVEALGRVFNPKKNEPVLIGGIKPNLGHSEGTSALAAVIKVTLAMENNIIPPTIGIKDMNPALHLSERNFQVVTQPVPWPASKLRRAGVNSFGYGGANGHAIIESAESYTPFLDKGERKTLNRRKGRHMVLPFSTHGNNNLLETARGFESFEIDNANIADLAFTLTSHRSRLPNRGYLLIEDARIDRDLKAKNLQTLDSADENIKLPIAFIFTGQGAQWPLMGQELLTAFPAYRKIIKSLDIHLKQLAHSSEWSIEETILEPNETSQINKASRSQTVCTAVQIALVELLHDWNITPSVVIGHSSGEICAAFAAGYLTAREAIAIAFYRGISVSKLSTNGAMAAVGFSGIDSEKEAANLGLQEQIQVACVNSPQSSTISGDVSAIDRFIEVAESKGIFARKLKTDQKAYHSHHVKEIGEEYERLLESVYSQRTSLIEHGDDDTSPPKMLSSVVGGLGTKQLVDTPSYWRRNLESPVLFHDAFQGVLESPHHLIEIGPHSMLLQPIKEIYEAAAKEQMRYVYSPTIVRGKDAEQSMLRLCGNLFLHQHPVALNRANRIGSIHEKIDGFTTGCKLIHNIPSYKWNHENLLWKESRVSAQYRQDRHQIHALLGLKVSGLSEQSFLWRNVLDMEKLSWINDHKLGNTVVFPGAGYLALAAEALIQLQKSPETAFLGVILRKVHISNVLTLQEDKGGVEIFTEIRPTPISGVDVSRKWWSFKISSVVDTVSTTHATGQVAGKFEVLTPNPRFAKLSIESMEDQATRTWYDKFAKEGLRFGPRFQSLTKVYNDGAKKLYRSISETCLNHHEEHPKYLIHPINLDALLQTGLIASAGGSVSRLGAEVPVVIESLEILIPPSTGVENQCTVFADSTSVGFGVINVNAELRSSSGLVLAQLGNVRCVSYEGKKIDTGLTNDERYPALRVLWKPDIFALNSGASPQLTEYIHRFSHSLRDHVLYHEDPSMARFVAAVSLLAHSNPRLRILELGNNDFRHTALILDLLQGNTSLKHFRTYEKAQISDDGKVMCCTIDGNIDLTNQEAQWADIGNDAIFDALIVPPTTTGLKLPDILTKQILSRMTPNATILLMGSGFDDTAVEFADYSVVSTTPLDGQLQIMIARAIETIPRIPTQAHQRIILAERNNTHELNALLAKKLSEYFDREIDRLDFENLHRSKVPSECIVICTAELEQPLLEAPTPDHVESLKMITDNASMILWVTGGGLFKAKRPSFALASGFSRTLNLEQPSNSMFLLDFDVETENIPDCANNIVAVLHQALCSSKPEFEYLQHKGALYSSRFVPEESMNKRFRRGQNSETVTLSLDEARYCRLNIKSPGQLDSLCFDQFLRKDTDIQPGYVEVKVQSIGLNAKDIYALHRKVDTKNSTCALEFTGLVTQVGSSESQFKPGDRVVVMAPSYFATYECVPEWACYHLESNEGFEVCSTIPVVSSTALYALEYRAQLHSGESILIHSATGGLGIAAIQIAKSIGAEIFATVGTQEKKDFLIQKMNIDENHIFNSRDSSFLSGIMKATSGRGVDVVLNSLIGDLLHDSWRACAEFGRFIEVGKYDIVNDGKLDMDVFKRGATFSAFDLSDMFWSKNEKHHEIWASLLRRSMQLYREGKIQPGDPLKVFDVSEVIQALRHFSSGSRIVVPIQFRTVFSPEKAYILIGCLGGLGRSLSKWMLDRGTRKFVFLGRSGTDREPARKLINDLQAKGAQTTVIRGNVSEAADVNAVVAQIQDPIGGVIHAAMGLDLALISEMTSKSWCQGINGKVQGAWNLHHALADRSDSLDFFLMTSSITGSIGQATESNYCGANAFLDAFARYRRRLGLPAVSLGLGMISEVGYLHEHPEIEALLLRKGVHPINEDELLQLVDIALSPDPVDTSARNSADFPADHFSEGHILTGLEALGLQKILSMGWERPTQVLDDPRTAIIAGGYAALAAAAQNKDNASEDINGGVTSSQSVLPNAIFAALDSQLSGTVGGGSDTSDNTSLQLQPSDDLI